MAIAMPRTLRRSIGFYRTVSPVSGKQYAAQKEAYVEDCEAQHQDEHRLHVAQHLCNEQYKVYQCLGSHV
jgi:hypothetical protein